MKNIIKKLSIMVLSTALFPVAHAATATANFNTSSTLQASCVVNINNMDFGTFTNDGTAAQAYTPINVTCTKGTSYTIKVNAGNGTFAQRHMKSANVANTDKLNYNLYNSSSSTTPYGDGSTGTAVSNGTGTGINIAHALFAKMTKNQFITPGIYSDTLVVTLEY